MSNIKHLLNEIIDEVLEEDLRIDKHPQADLIKKAVGDENHLISFSDINKVGINPGTSFNTPAGIYGWHFTQRTLRGAKKNKIFASERKYGHLLKIKNPDKVLWLGTDQTGTSAKSPAEAMKLFIKAYPVLNEPKIQFDDEGVVNPQYDGDGGKKISAAEWLRDSEVVAGYRMTSSRQTGGESKSEKLYDLVMATSAVLELDMIAGKKKTVAANALLRSLGIDAVVDKDCKGVIHNAETCQGFFTHKGGLEHVATIENRLYSLNKTAVSRILQSPNAPEDKLWDAINALTKDFAQDLGSTDPDFGDEISTDDALDILRDAVGGLGIYETGVEGGNKNLTADMLTHIFKFAAPRQENSVVAQVLMEDVLEHPNAPQELLKSYMETAIKQGNSKILAAIAANPEMTTEELTKIAESGRAVDHRVEVALGSNANTSPEVLAKLAEMFLTGGSVAGSVVALKNPNTPIETVNKWAGRYRHFRELSTQNPARPLAALSNPNVDDSIVAGLIFDENAEVKEDFKTLRDIAKLENLPAEYMEELVNWLARGNYSQSSINVANITDTFNALFSNKTIASSQLYRLLKSYPEVLPHGNEDWEYVMAWVMWEVLNHDNLSREVLELANDLWVKDSVRMVNDGIITKNRFDAINNLFSEKEKKAGNQKESIQNTLKQMIKEELLSEAKFENEATQISREIMKKITDHLEANDGETRIPHRFIKSDKDLEKRFGYGGYGQSKVPEALASAGVTKIVIEMRVEPSTAFGEGITFGTQGSAMMGDEDGERDRMVVIKVFLSDTFTKNDLSLLNARLKNTLAHEFTHGGQPEDLLVTSGEAQMSAMRKGLKTLEAISAYYLDAAEIEAFARGMYKQAKMTKTPFHKMVDIEIARNLAFYAHPKEIALAEYSEEEITLFFEDDYRQALLDYARKNLPAAVLENQDFISSLREVIKEEMDEWKPTGEEMMFPAIYLTSHMGEYDKEPHWKEWRKKSDEEKFAWAEKMDFSEPVEITVFADGTFGHGDGHHRVMAGKVLDIEIPIIITRNKLKEYEAGVWEKWLNAALHKSPKQLNPEGYNLKTMETLDYILNSREQKENKQMNLSQTIRDMIEEEITLNKPFLQLNEISSEVYDGVVNAAANLSDSQMSPLFGEQERVLIPMKADGNEQVQAFYDNIVTPLATKGIKVNLEDGTATKEVTTQRGKQERKTRLGKAIGKELSDTAKTWWNKFQAEFLGNPDILKAKYGIVITQHPVDVARMSDFSEADIQSCHSEGSDYFTCALADAKRAGAVAYLINGEDVDYAEQNLDDNELFADDNRGVEGITPISRVRLRRFDNPDLAEQGSALALLAPETRIYGERVPGFLNTVADWAREVQKGHPVFKKKLDLRGFTLRGGSYQDTTSSEMFNILVGPENLELNPELEAYGYSDQTRKESGEEQIDYVDDGRNREMVDYAIDQIESFRYDLLDHESVNFEYSVEWDDWNESVEISYEVSIAFDYKFANFAGSPNLGKGTEEELLKALDREAPLSAIRLVAETAYEDSEYRNYDIETFYSVKIVDQRFGADTRKIVQFKMFLNDGAYSADDFESDIARGIETITDSYDEINAEIEEALREDGWMIETSYDKLKVDPEHAGKLGEDSFDLFNISKGPNGIAARMMIPMKGYPDAGMRKSDGVDVLYKEGPKFVEIMRSDSPLWDVKGGFAVLPPQRRSNVLRALKREIKDAAKAAAMQPSLPMGDLPAGEDKDMRPILPAIEEVQVFMRQVHKNEISPYRKKDSANYGAEGGIMFTFKPGSSEEQIQANLKFIKYFDKNPIPVQAALQKEWNDIADNFAAAQPLVEPEAKKEKEPEEEASHLDAYKESVSSLLRNLIKEELLSEMFVKGHEDGDNIIAYKENIWKLRMDIEEDDPVRQEIAQALRLEGEWNDIWDLKELVEDAGRTDILVGEFNEQDRQLSLQRVGSFHLDPKSSVLVKKVVKTIGAQSVVYAPNDEGEEYTSKYDIKGKVADIMYHGTTSNYLPGLLRLGLVPGKKETNYEGISHPSAVFFTSRFDEAQHHATHTAKKVGGDPVILELKVPDPALLIPDYDVDMGAGDTGCYDYICQTLRDKQSSQSDVDADSFSLSREVGVYGYKGRVPAAAISGYHILMNAQDELGDNMFYADREQYTEATPEEAAIYVQTKEDFGYGSLEEPEYEEDEDDWGTNESILSNLRNLIKEELVK